MGNPYLLQTERGKLQGQAAGNTVQRVAGQSVQKGTPLHLLRWTQHTFGVLQTERGKLQARAAGKKIRGLMEGDRAPYSLFFYTSPYKRSKQTHEEICSAFDPKHLVGSQEEVQLREQVGLQTEVSNV